MRKTNLLNNGIPISPSLNPTLEAEHFEPRKGGNKKRLLIISSVAFLIAVFVSVIAKFLVLLIDLFTNISFYGSFSFSHSNPATHSLGIFVIIIPVIGGVVVGLMAFYGSKAIRGHGIPEAMEQILTNQSKIKPAITFLKPLSSAIAIGTGGPFGAEGPIIATGGALGSTIGQLLKISHNERKILLSAGATAGMAAIFGSPIAAIFLAIELLLFEFSPRSLIPVAIACIVGSTGHHLLFGQNPVFGMDAIAIPTNSALLAYSIMGIMIGILSVGVSKAVYFVEDGFEKIPVHWMWWPAIGGLLVGVIGYFAPRTLGVGYENITDILSGNLTTQVILSLCFLKFISWAVALGSGTSGGTLAPLLTVGGAAGALLGMAIMHFFPQSGINIPLAALVGMASMFAGASRALLTSIIFAFETTSQSNALLPLLGACLGSYFVSFFLMEHTIMTEKIARRGVKTPHSYEPDILERITVEQVLTNNGMIISEDNSIKEVREWLNQEPDYKSKYFIVSNNEGEYKGILNSLNLYGNDNSPENKIGTLLTRNHSSIRLSDTLRIAAETMAKENVDVLPVITNENKNIVGILSYHDILATYKHGIDDHEMKRPHISLKRNGLKILLRGQKLVSVIKRKEK
ncbi:MAG TPA: chloride channel protein [Cyclobacteriaceae bacterium]|nr:chloride channel protein [Cyclobacteriaceae bacterium]